MKTHSENKIVYLYDIWMDAVGDISIVEDVDCNRSDKNTIQIRCITGSCKDNRYWEDEYNFNQNENPYFDRLIFRPLTGYKNDEIIDNIAEEQNGIQIF